MPISPPKDTADYPDRFVTCEQAIEEEIKALIARATDSGWDETEVCVAIGSLADHHVLAMLADDETRRQIASADPTGIVLRKDR